MGDGYRCRGAAAEAVVASRTEARRGDVELAPEGARARPRRVETSSARRRPGRRLGRRLHLEEHLDATSQRVDLCLQCCDRSVRLHLALPEHFLQSPIPSRDALRFFVGRRLAPLKLALSF